MLLQSLFSSPLMVVVWLSAITIAITVHEFSHALVANIRGDKTAERLGRLTLNPIAHIDPIGFLMLFILGFGWAKPVPFNPYNLKNPRYDAVWIALAGPFSNLIMAILSSIAFRVLISTEILPMDSLLWPFLMFSTIINLFLLFFNLIPVHPLDGSKLVDAILVKPHQQNLRRMIETYGPKVLLVMVLMSIIGNIDVFYFISAPAYKVCSLLMGTSCG